MIRKAWWIAAAIITFGFPIPGVSPANHHPLVVPRVIRLRVIANSDNPIDQAVKLSVRDLVLEVLKPRMTHVHTRAQALRVISTSQGPLVSIADRLLRRWHLGYQAHISLARTEFPTKAYGRLILPAGSYMALLVKLGQAQGHNWWCVLYPSLCFIDMSNGLAVPRQRVQAPDHLTRRGGSLHLQVSWRVPNFILRVVHFLRHV